MRERRILRITKKPPTSSVPRTEARPKIKRPCRRGGEPEVGAGVGVGVTSRAKAVEVAATPSSNWARAVPVAATAVSNSGGKPEGPAPEVGEAFGAVVTLAVADGVPGEAVTVTVGVMEGGRVEVLVEVGPEVEVA